MGVQAGTGSRRQSLQHAETRSIRTEGQGGCQLKADLIVIWDAQQHAQVMFSLGNDTAELFAPAEWTRERQQQQCGQIIWDAGRQMPLLNVRTSMCRMMAANISATLRLACDSSP